MPPASLASSLARYSVLSSSPGSECYSTILVQSIIKVSSYKLAVSLLVWYHGSHSLPCVSFLLWATFSSPPASIQSLRHCMISCCHLSWATAPPRPAIVFFYGHLSLVLSLSLSPSLTNLSLLLISSCVNNLHTHFPSFLFIYCTCRHFNKNNNKMHAYLGSWTERQINLNSFRENHFAISACL